MRRNAGSQKWTRENRYIDQSMVQTLQKTPDPLAILHRRKGCEQGTSISEDVQGSLSGLAHLRWADKPNGCGAKKVSRWCFHSRGLGEGLLEASGWVSRRILLGNCLYIIIGGASFVWRALRSLFCDVPRSARGDARPRPEGHPGYQTGVGVCRRTAVDNGRYLFGIAEVEVDLESSRRWFRKAFGLQLGVSAMTY